MLWFFPEFWRFVLVQQEVAKLGQSFIDYPPMQKGASFNLEAVKAQIQRIVETLPPGIERPDLSNLTLYSPVPSENNPYGYNGQIALREQYTMVPGIRALLEHGDTTSTQQIEAAAVASGMRTMLQDGILKVIAGLTTLEEVLRVVG